MSTKPGRVLVMPGSRQEGEHRGPILGAKQDGEVVCQCLTCGKAWTASGRILQDGPVPCQDREAP